MTITIGGKKYVPGMYKGRSHIGINLTDAYFHELKNKMIQREKEKGKTEFFPTICFSRKIGVGALEVADILARDIGYRVIDREILTHISSEAKLHEKTVAIFDECYPGKMQEFINYLFGEKSFIKSDFSRKLISCVLSLASMEPTIFVGRGAHLIMPRDRLLSVLFICSDKHRIKRLARVLEVNEKDAAEKLEQIDKDQSEFYKNAFGKNDVKSAYQFDLVINFDFLSDPNTAAKIVALAFREKFASELKNK